MNGPMAFCPRCKRDVIFTEGNSFRRCTVCGAQFELVEPRAGEPPMLESVVMTVGHILLRVVLIIGIVLLIGVAVVFASCAFH